jgi:hypothetical protein
VSLIQCKGSSVSYQQRYVVLMGIASAILFGSVGSQPALAAIIINNAGFESNPQADGGVADLVPAGWTTISSSGFTGVWNPDANDGPNPTPGEQFGYAYANGSATGAATLYQQVDTAYLPSTEYSLSVLVGDGSRDNGSAGYLFPTQARIGLYNATTGIAGLLTSPIQVTTIATSPGDGLAAYYTASFTTGSIVPSGPVIIGLTAFGSAGGVRLATFDDVTLSAVALPVPEPSSLILLAGSGLLAAARRRRE